MTPPPPHPAAQAYGARGSPDGAVGPNAPLVYYLELVDLGEITGDRPRLPGDREAV